MTARPIAVLMTLTLLGPTLAAPETSAARTATPPAIDGVLDEPAWSETAWTSGFTLAGKADPEGQPAVVQTRFKVLVDDTAVYVGVECDEPQVDQLKANTPWRDGALWQDDCVEVFFDPGNEGRYYHQVMVNARGTIYDCHNADYGLVHSRLWNGAFEAAGHVDREAKKWSVELAIPFGAIVLGESAGSAWKWNVARERQAGGATEFSSWAPMRGNFHEPRRFGTLTGLPADYSAFRLRVGEPQVDVSSAGSGVKTLTMRLPVRNPGGPARRLVATAAVLEQPQVSVAAEPLELAVGDEAVIDFPPLQVRGATGQTNVVFSLREPDGRLVCAVVKSLASDYRPLAIRVLQPCYRHTIYATQRIDELVFEVTLSAQVRAATAQLSCRLTAADGAVVAERTVPVEQAEKPISLPVRDLPEGRYTLRAQAVGAGGAAEAEAEETIAKVPPPPAGHEVRIDEHRRILVDGKPVLCIGWYGGIPTEDPRADVVALQNIVTPEVPRPPDTGGIARRFAERGIYTIVSVENGRLYYSFDLWRQDKKDLAGIVDEVHTLTEPSEITRRLAKELVDTVRGEPGLLGYYIADEPEIHDVPSAYLENYYQYLRELDPYHPVFVTNDTIDGIVTHGYKCADVLSPDPYSPEWDYVPNFLKKVNEVATVGKATHVTLWHSVGHTHFTQDWGSGPAYPYRVFRNQYLASVAYGATGFTAYTSAFFMPEIEYRYGLPHVWRELRFLEPAILAPPPPDPVVVEGAPELATWAREVNGRIYVLAVHHKTGAVDATLRWRGFGERKSLYVMSEGRELEVSDGALRDHFAEGDVHLYTDDPAARDLPTTAAILAELDQRRQETVKPGNLFSVERGTRIRSSDVYYAPWFTQYYYYALNGITDDQGWYAYRWGGKPCWFELTLPEPADLGRIVIYSPNLRDYRIELTGPDGQGAAFDVEGNQDDVITHHLRPAVRCLKLRLIATAIRPDAKPSGGPLVAEIEGYTEPGDGEVTPVEPLQGEQAAATTPLFVTAEPAIAWADDFDAFDSNPQYYWDARDTKWVLKPEDLLAEAADGRLTLAARSKQGYAGMSRILPYDPNNRFLQVSCTGIEGEGYRFWYAACGNPSGAPGYRGGVNANRPGIYTVDTHYVHEAFRTGADPRCLLTVSVAGAHRHPDDTVTPGPRFTYDWIRFARRPLDGLAVTLADGAPLPEAVGEGDTLHFELHLTSPAQDAVVEVQTDAPYNPLAINGEPYVPLRRADQEGCVWVGQVTIGPGTGKFTPQGYPTVFRAVITGGAIRETFASAFVGFR